MNHKTRRSAEAEAWAKMERYKAETAKRGIRYDGSAAIPEIEFGDEPTVLGPQSELSYRRLLKEMKED